MKWLRGAKSLLFMTCRDAAPLISHAMDHKLGRHDRAAVGLHLAVCTSCRRYRDQLAFLRSCLAQMHGAGLRSDASTLSPKAKTRIRVRLERGAGTN
jgi:predicted anti-sigma-YlaC factor YlaD